MRGLGFISTAAAAGVLAVAMLGGAERVEASTITSSGLVCKDLAAGQNFATFVSCQGPALENTVNPTNQDTFSRISGEVSRLFSITLDGTLSFSPGSSSGSEFSPSSPISSNGLAATGSANSWTFTSLPTSTLFISFKQSTNWELFRVPQLFLNGTESSFTITHGIGNGTSHISTFAGTAPIPLPAAGWLLLGGLGALGAAARRKRRMAA